MQMKIEPLTIGNAEIQPTGNPFVDTGLYAMLAKAAELHPECPPESLTPDLVKEVMGDGKWLAQANRQLNSFTMACTNNTALTNPSINKRMNSTKQLGFLDPEDKGWQQYVATLLNLLQEFIDTEQDDHSVCESCGTRGAAKSIPRVGREFFPLAGSLGSDAQALPAASRSPRICPLCLLAIQWLPLGAQMCNGKLACFQYTDALLSYFAVKNSFAEVASRLGAAKLTHPVEVPGSGEGARQAGLFLFEQMRRLHHERHLNDLPPQVTLNIWTFSNSGPTPVCDVTEVPHPALQFLWVAAQMHLQEVQELLRREDPKKSQTHLLNRIARGRDYSGFYPAKGKKGEDARVASKSLYQLYQTHVLGRSLPALAAAERLAVAVYAQLTSGGPKEQKKNRKRLDAMLKESPRSTADQTIRMELRRLCADLAEAGQFTLDEYVSLFPAATLEKADNTSPEGLARFWREPGRAVKASRDGWDVFWFYLHHAAKGSQAENAAGAAVTSRKELGGGIAMFTNPKIKSFARDVFDYYLEKQGGKDRRRGLEWIKKNILEKFKRQEITTGTLRRWFCLLAEIKPEYQNEDWDALCRDDSGREMTGELRFQFRLEIANLYREATQLPN